MAEHESADVRREKQLRGVRASLGQVREHLQADFCVRLWNEEVVPLKEGACQDMQLVLTSPQLVRRLLLKPNLVTLVQEAAGGGIRLEGGSPYDFLRRFDYGAGIHLVRRMDKVAAARAALPFLLGGKTDDGTLPGYRKDAGGSFEKRDDEEMIAFHYDVSNAFFGLFLDEEMVYSSAYYRSDEDSLEEAQRHKLDMICRKLRLRPGQALLDIGCGWGALACHAAQHYGVTVRGLTLSKEQLAYGEEKVRRLGLEDQVLLELKDYRETAEEDVTYDAVAQVEMFEHVGWENFDRHFEIVRRLLKPGGVHYHQATTRRGGRDLRRFRRRTKGMEFITTYIFPGGELDYIGNTITNMGRLGLEVVDAECLRDSYILTLKEWERRLKKHRGAAAREAGEARTMFWQIYFALFALTFERGVVSNYAVVAVKRRPGRTGLPLDRGLLYAP